MSEFDAEYDDFAAIYNRHWGAEYHAQVLPVVERLLLSRISAGATVLDVCCGNGKFTAAVQQRGFRVTGLDVSKEMLAYARRNAPDTEFILADARQFSTGQTFAAAYSVFESLNHVPDLSGLRAAFRCVREHLESGALFLFDLNREDAFLTQWNEVNAIVDDDLACALRSEYDEAAREGRCRVTVFALVDSTWERKDFKLCQTCHDINRVHHLLQDTGFSNVNLYDGADIGMDEHTAYARTFLLATAA